MTASPVFVETWIPDKALVTLAGLVAAVSDVPGRIIELGSWEGRSTLVIADATDRVVHAVDTWAGSDSDVYQRTQIAEGRDVFAAFTANLGERNVQAYQMDWQDFIAATAGEVALVFIDADHTYEQLTAQIDAFLPLMAAGGIMCGDDRQMRPVRRALRHRFYNDYQHDGRIWWKHL